MKHFIFVLMLSCSQSLYAESGGWITREGKPIPNTDSMKSVDGFGASLLVTPDADWEAKWNTSPDTVPHFRTASKVKYGEQLTILTFFINPKVDKSGAIDVVCDIEIIRPNKTQSSSKAIECAKGQFQGDPYNVRLTSAIIKFIGEKNDPSGVWQVNVIITDRNRKAAVPLKTQFELVK